MNEKFNRGNLVYYFAKNKNKACSTGNNRSRREIKKKGDGLELSEEVMRMHKSV